MAGRVSYQTKTMATTQAVTKTTEDKVMEYVPHGAQDKIKLTISIVKNLIAVRTKSGVTCSDNEAIKFMMMCSAKKLNPFEQDAYLIGYDGREGATFSLITAHQAFLKRAESNPDYDGMRSGIIVEEDGVLKDIEGDFFIEGKQKVVGGWAIVYSKTKKFPMSKRIRLKRFQKSFGVWQDDPAGMIAKCAEADALRSSFPTLLGGLYLREETQVEAEKPSKPIFETKTAPAETVTTEVVAEKSPVKTGDSHVVALRKRIVAAQVYENDVLGFLKQVGALPEDSQIETLENLEADESTVFSMLSEQFDDIIARVKGEKQ